MSITELKAAAYDTLANIEHLQRKLAEINQAISEALKKEEEEKENG